MLHLLSNLLLLLQTHPARHKYCCATCDYCSKGCSIVVNSHSGIILLFYDVLYTLSGIKLKLVYTLRLREKSMELT